MAGSAMTTHLLPRPKSEADAEREFLRAFGDPRLLCKFLAVAIAGVSVVAGFLAYANFRLSTQQRDRIVVRIDDVGRYQALGMAGSWSMQDREVKFFLGQFVHSHYGRKRATVMEDYPRSLLYFETSLATAKQEDDRRNKTIEKWFLSGDDEIDIEVNKIVLGDLSKAPYSAQVDIDKVYRDRSHNETKREKYTVSVSFVLAKDVPNDLIMVNPLGFAITDTREDQYFK